MRILSVLCAVLLAAPAYAASGAERPHVLLILVDTLRPDHLGVYGYARDTSPNIDRLAAEGLVFDRVYSSAPWTNPAIVTLFTGLYPQSVLPPAPHAKAIRQTLPDTLTTLAEAMQADGYATVALVDHPGITPRLGYAQGFDVFTRLFKAAGGGAWSRTSSEFVFDAVDEQLARMQDGPPTFLYLHLIYPHRPYAPPPPYDTMFGPKPERLTRTQRDGVINLYDAEVRYTDALIGRIADRMRERGLLERSIVALVADHGEAFWEHGKSEHGSALYDEQIRIPLILRAPAGHPMQRGRTDALTSLVDLYPTLQRLAGVVPHKPMEGRPLFDKRGALKGPRSMVFSESPHRDGIRAAASIGFGRKYIRTSRWKHELFDLRADPGEHDDRMYSTELFGDELWSLTGGLSEHRITNERYRRLVESKHAEPDADTEERLRALGYVD